MDRRRIYPQNTRNKKTRNKKRRFLNNGKPGAAGIADTQVTIFVYNAGGKLVAEYGQKSDGLGGVKYIQQDWQGSVRTVTNANGFVVARTDHQAFGGEIGYGTPSACDPWGAL